MHATTNKHPEAFYLCMLAGVYAQCQKGPYNKKMKKLKPNVYGAQMHFSEWVVKRMGQSEWISENRTNTLKCMQAFSRRKSVQQLNTKAKAMLFTLRVSLCVCAPVRFSLCVCVSVRVCLCCWSTHNSASKRCVWVVVGDSKKKRISKNPRQHHL